MATIQTELKLPPCIPRGFVELAALTPKEANVDRSSASKQAHLEHDVCKFRVALYLLQGCKPDSDFQGVIDLLIACKAPSLQGAYGKSNKTARAMMDFLVHKTVQQTAQELMESPMSKLSQVISKLVDTSFTCASTRVLNGQ